jgi:tripartite-type tricarboxylate transporter receptor subunit TctC
MKKLLALILLVPVLAFAWEPTRPINVTVGFAPGSGNEVSFRGVSSLIEKQNKNVNFVIMNRPGADGVVAMNDFITQPNDGYHIYVPSHQGIWVTAEYFNKGAVKYNLNDFEYVVSIAKSPLAIVVPIDSNITTVPTLINLVKNTTKPISVAAGSGAHKLAYNYMSDRLRLNDDLIKTISYKGPAQALVAVASKEVDFGILPVAVAKTLDGTKVRILAICGEKRLTQIPAIPLMSDYIPGMNVYAGWSIILPKGTNKEIVDWYVKNFSQAINSPEAQQFFDSNLMFSDARLTNPKGAKEDMMKLRQQWIPIISKLNLEQ